MNDPREWGASMSLIDRLPPEFRDAKWDWLTNEIAALESKSQEQERLLNTPEVYDFVVAVNREASHQRGRWGSDHDAGKTDADWFWLIGYLAGKALHNPGEDPKGEKRLHRVVTIAAAAANWHAALLGKTNMRPGISDPEAIAATPATKGSPLACAHRWQRSDLLSPETITCCSCGIVTKGSGVAGSPQPASSGSTSAPEPASPAAVDPYHGCLTGDCPHGKQSECDAALAADALNGVEENVEYDEPAAPVKTEASPPPGAMAKDIPWLHKFINCMPFGANAPAEDIQRAHGIVNSARAELAQAIAERDRFSQAASDNARLLGKADEERDAARAEVERVMTERNLLVDAITMDMRSTGISNAAHKKIDAFRAAIERSKEKVLTEHQRLSAGWRESSERAKKAEAERDAAITEREQVVAELARVRVEVVSLKEDVAREIGLRDSEGADYSSRRVVDGQTILGLRRQVADLHAAIDTCRACGVTITERGNGWAVTNQRAIDAETRAEGLESEQADLLAQNTRLSCQVLDLRRSAMGEQSPAWTKTALDNLDVARLAVRSAMSKTASDLSAYEDLVDAANAITGVFGVLPAPKDGTAK